MRSVQHRDQTAEDVMKHHDPKHPSEVAFEDRPTGKWRTLGAGPGAELEGEREEAAREPKQLAERAN